MENLKTFSLFEKKDPVRNLWRNVLIVAIEDLVKKATVAAKFSQYYAHSNKSALEYFLIPNEDFNLICEYSGFDPEMVRNKIIKKLKEIKLTKGKNGKNYLSKMPRKWVHKSKTLSRQSSGNNSTVSTL